jgi:hypothetical protein
MTNLSWNILVLDDSIIPEKGGSLFFIFKNFETFDKTEF